MKQISFLLFATMTLGACAGGPPNDGIMAHDASSAVPGPLPAAGPLPRRELPTIGLPIVADSSSAEGPSAITTNQIDGVGASAPGPIHADVSQNLSGQIAGSLVLGAVAPAATASHIEIGPVTRDGATIDMIWGADHLYGRVALDRPAALQAIKCRRYVAAADSNPKIEPQYGLICSGTTLDVTLAKAPKGSPGVHPGDYEVRIVASQKHDLGDKVAQVPGYGSLALPQAEAKSFAVSKLVSTNKGIGVDLASQNPGDRQAFAGQAQTQP